MVISFEEFDWHNNSENTKVEEILSSDDLLFFLCFVSGGAAGCRELCRMFDGQKKSKNLFGSLATQNNAVNAFIFKTYKYRM